MKSLEERRKIVEPMLALRMPPKTATLVRDSLVNRVIEGCCTSYEFEIGALSYRGVWISTIEDIEVKVDGETIPYSNMMFFCNGLNYPIPDMGKHSECFWGIKDRACLRIYRPGGLPKGTHRVSITIYKRADFGHSFGDGEDGFEDAQEFQRTQMIKDSCEFTVK